MLREIEHSLSKTTITRLSCRNLDLKEDKKAEGQLRGRRGGDERTGGWAVLKVCNVYKVTVKSFP